MAHKLDSLLKAAARLLLDLKTLLSTIQRDPSSGPTTTTATTTTTDPFSTARDAAALIRAHSTKLALVVITPPWTPPAAASVIRALIDGPVPLLASAVQACSHDAYTCFARRELACRCARVLAELQALLLVVQRRLDARQDVQGERDARLATGILWEACDNVGRLADLHVGGLLVHKTIQDVDLLQDTFDELKDWGDEESCSDCDDDSHNHHDTVNQLADQLHSSRISAQDLADSLFDSQRPIPSNDPTQIRPRLATCLKRLRLIILLYQGTLKRRLKTIPTALTPAPSSPTSSSPPLPHLAPRLDQLATVLQALPQRFEHVAAALYRLDATSADQELATCAAHALLATSLLKHDWSDAPDAFTHWLNKFDSEMSAPKSHE